MSKASFTPGTNLTLLFDVHLQYQDGKSPLHAGGKVGELIGSGVGHAEGEQIRGEVQWTLFEDVGENVCHSNLFGVITTPDNAQLRFDTMGFFMVPDKRAPHLWVTSAAVRFESEDERYAWLNPVLGVWTGTFNMQTYRHHYQVYIPRDTHG